MKTWRPKLGESVKYFDDYSRTWRVGKIHSYEGQTLVAVDLACHIARARFNLNELRKV